MVKSQLFYIYNYTVVKVRLSCLWCCVCYIVLLTLCCCCFLRACHEHNKIAPCGMIKVFWIELKRSQEVQRGTRSHALTLRPRSCVSLTLPSCFAGCHVHQGVPGNPLRRAGSNRQTKRWDCPSQKCRQNGTSLSLMPRSGTRGHKVSARPWTCSLHSCR